MSAPNSQAKTALLVGASRGLGHAIAAQLLQKGLSVVGTVRAGKRTPFHDLVDANPSRAEVEALDMNEPAQLEALHERLGSRTFDILFVNAGTTNRDPSQTIGQVSTDEFVEIMITNALSPMRVVERFEHCIAPNGLIGVMSSGQGSITNNVMGQRELYRGSKAALNQFMRSFAARQKDTARALVVTAPGWIKTALGGPDAPLTIEETIPKLVDVLLAKMERPGLEYLDYKGNTVPW
ncbi:MAG TPA: SDR family NAD(P)-dependent oxidoreductase [Polyangiaceae bacterium]